MKERMMAVDVGDVIRHVGSDEVFVITSRKDTNDGWWLDDGGYGIADKALASGRWEVLPPAQGLAARAKQLVTAAQSGRRADAWRSLGDLAGLLAQLEIVLAADVHVATRRWPADDGEAK